MLIGGPGNDTLDGGPGNNVVIDSLSGNGVTSATFAGKDWLSPMSAPSAASRAVRVGGKVRTLPHADLIQLIRIAASR